MATAASVSPRAKRAQVDENLSKAIAKLQTVSEKLVEGKFVAETQDNEDHTFSGIIFDLEGKTDLPYQFVELQSVAVRGDLGVMSVYVCMNSKVHTFVQTRRLSDTRGTTWERRFGPKLVKKSPYKFVELEFDIPVRLAPGQIVGIYIHSELQSDSAVVYDNLRTRKRFTHEDKFIAIHPAIAHTSPIAFSPTNIWGGNSWRLNRAFVGSVRYGVKMMLWTPTVHDMFPDEFQRHIFALLCCHNRLEKVKGSCLGKLPVDVVFKIVNMMPYDWFLDASRKELDDSEYESENNEEDEDN